MPVGEIVDEEYRSMNRKRKLTEGTSNFWSMDYFPLLIFADYETEDDKAREYALGEMSEEEIEDMEDNYDFEYDCPRFAELVDEYYDKYADYCILDEDEVDMLKNDLDEFNKDIRGKYYDVWYEDEPEKSISGDDWDGEYPVVEIKDGYYEAAQLYITVHSPAYSSEGQYTYLLQQQVDEVNAFLREMQKKYGLTEMGVSYRASNGETGYHKVESLKQSRSRKPVRESVRRNPITERKCSGDGKRRRKMMTEKLSNTRRISGNVRNFLR